MDKIKANVTKNKKGAGRPKIIVDIEILKNLASIGCPDYEIASVLNVSARTLNRNYAEIIDQFREKGKASLRKKMWDKAVKKDNTMMQIWLSKNYLGMKDRTQTETITEPLPLIIEAKAEEVKDLNGKKKG
jgi:hypothetical protein|tara:strand:+ start:797 stop:1189 length:393 start_codon:yes stop_codon:yes gene_type:complete